MPAARAPRATIPKRAGRVRIGISGWAYTHWRPHFYPKEIKDRDRLPYYARHFDTLEINSTFYRPAPEAYLTRWRDAVPADFLFAVKAWRRLTHFERLKVEAAEVTSFLNSLAPLGKKLGPVLFQFPADFEADVPLLASFLEKLPSGHRYAFELRHATWWTPGVFSLLRKHNAAFCIFDLRQKLSPLQVTADFIYVRLHGPKRPYFDHYAETVLRTWAGRVRQWTRDGRDVYFFFNNTDEAAATGDATFLKTALAGRRKSVPQS